jgi:hypothetical protein
VTTVAIETVTAVLIVGACTALTLVTYSIRRIAAGERDQLKGDRS